MAVKLGYNLFKNTVADMFLYFLKLFLALFRSGKTFFAGNFFIRAGIFLLCAGEAGDDPYVSPASWQHIAERKKRWPAFLNASRNYYGHFLVHVCIPVTTGHQGLNFVISRNSTENNHKL